MFVVPQRTLAYNKLSGLILLGAPGRTGRIRTHGAPHPGRFRSSKLRDTVQRRGFEPHFPARTTGNKTVLVSLARPGFLIVEHTVADSGSKAREIGPLTLRTEYPAPRSLISHFQCIRYADNKVTTERTNPLPSSRAVAGLQHTSLKCSWTSI